MTKRTKKVGISGKVSNPHFLSISSFFPLWLSRFERPLIARKLVRRKVRDPAFPWLALRFPLDHFAGSIARRIALATFAPN